MSPPYRFLVDGMLGSLARWLRIMGQDARYARDLQDGEALRQARAEERFLLTRDRELAARAAPGSLYVSSDDLDEQLLQVMAAFGLHAQGDMTRCTACNGLLEGVSREQVKDVVPKGSLDAYERFYRCQDCGKVYWQGSHWARIQERLAALESRAGRSPR